MKAMPFSLLTALAATLLASSVGLAQGAGTMEATPCPLPLVYEGETEGETFDCGIVIVPENHDDQESRTLELAWLRMKATTLAPREDPVVYLSGGPGSSAIHEFATNQPLYQNLQTIRQRRDVILYDQRGTGHSQLLACGLWHVAIGVVGELFSTAEDRARLIEAQETDDGQVVSLRTCAQGYAASGIDLANYNSVASAKDVALLTTALGYDGEYNLVGTSYGTRLALNAMRSTPDRIRSVIVDGTTSPGIPGNAYTSADVQYAYDSIFEQCAADAFCAETYPDPRANFISLLGQLQDDPIVFDPPLVPSDFLRAFIKGPVKQLDGHFFVEFAAFNNRALQGGLASVLPLVTQLALERDIEGLRTVLGRGTLPDVQATSGPPSAEDVIIPDDIYLASAISTLVSVAHDMQQANDLSISDEWVRLAVTELAERLTSGETQAEVIKDTLELAILPLAGTDPEAFTAFADEFLTADTASEANALVTSMSRQEVREANWTIAGIFANLLGLPERDFISQAILFSINCQEDIGFNPPEVAGEFIAASPYPGLVTQGLDSYTRFYQACDQYPAPFTREEMFAHVESDIPTLIFSGGLDTQTPVNYGEIVHENLPRSIFKEWPANGHIILTMSLDGCAGAIGAAFFDEPETAPDMSCSLVDAYRIPFEEHYKIMAEKLAAN